MKISILQTPGGGLCIIHYTVTIQFFCQPQIFVRQQWNIGYQDSEFLRIAHRHFQSSTVTASSFASSATIWGLPCKQKSEAPAWAKLTTSVINKRLILCSVGHTGSMWLTQALAVLSERHCSNADGPQNSTPTPYQKCILHFAWSDFSQYSPIHVTGKITELSFKKRVVSLNE